MVELSDEFKKIDLPVRLGWLEMMVNVMESNYSALGLETERRLEAIRQRLTLDAIHELKAVAATRQVYKALGKDPSRYRPSAEALLRRVVQGKGLYQINNVVDALNLVSVTSGFSIGGYDYERIAGSITLGKGRAGERYEAIGRGPLNIEGLPVLRDDLGAFGSPTSDSQRTRVQGDTELFLAVFFDFTENKLPLVQALDDLSELLVCHAGGRCISKEILELSAL